MPFESSQKSIKKTFRRIWSISWRNSSNLTSKIVKLLLCTRKLTSIDVKQCLYYKTACWTILEDCLMRVHRVQSPVRLTSSSVRKTRCDHKLNDKVPQGTRWRGSWLDRNYSREDVVHQKVLSLWCTVIGWWEVVFRIMMRRSNIRRKAVFRKGYTSFFDVSFKNPRLLLRISMTVHFSICTPGRNFFKW